VRDFGAGHGGLVMSGGAGKARWELGLNNGWRVVLVS
jgi:hypothetical protein